MDFKGVLEILYAEAQEDEQVVADGGALERRTTTRMPVEESGTRARKRIAAREELEAEVRVVLSDLLHSARENEAKRARARAEAQHQQVGPPAPCPAGLAALRSPTTELSSATRGRLQILMLVNADAATLAAGSFAANRSDPQSR